MKFIWKYYIPILIIAVGLLTLSGPSDQPILKSVPIVPGSYQVEIAIAFIVVGLILGVLVYRHGKRKESGKGN